MFSWLRGSDPEPLLPTKNEPSSSQQPKQQQQQQPTEATALMSAPAPAAPKPSYVALDGLRTVLTLLVMWCHVTLDTPQPRPEAPPAVSFIRAWWEQLFPGGFFPVDAFFIAAGFLTTFTGKLGPSGTCTARLKYMGQRYLRLAPMYYVGMFLQLLVEIFALGARWRGARPSPLKTDAADHTPCCAAPQTRAVCL